ncbi:MAG TPA: hypothetical protein VG498_05170 [Terriglobales bacterium]|nr:hypothetical protein [Terriglobales bacterium]
MAFAFVWITGMILSLVTLRLAITGKLWDLGFPSWLITLSVLVGIWQWMWIAPMLRFASRRSQSVLYNGLLRGGISFSIFQLAVSLVLCFAFRKLSLQ